MSILEEAGQEAQQAAEGQESARNVMGRTQWQLTWLRLRNDKVSMIALGVVILMIVIAIAAPAFAALTHHAVDAAYPDTGEDASGNPVGPGVAGFPLGTDSTGRDLLVRIVYGARISLFVGVVTTFIAVVLGTAVGLIAGYFGGFIDTILARLTDAVLAFPYVLLALALATVFGPSLALIVGLITFFSWAGIARIVRGQTLSLKEKEYIEAARSLGAGPFRIMFFDILPNLLAPVLVVGTLYIPAAVIFESTLSFLGLGIQPPHVDLGSLIASGEGDATTLPWLFYFPAAFLVLAILAVNFIGDGLRDALDPTQRGH